MNELSKVDVVFPLLERLKFTADLLAFFRKYSGVRLLKLLYGWGYTDDQYVCRPSMLRIVFADAETHERYLLKWCEQVDGRPVEQFIRESKGNLEESLASNPWIKGFINNELANFFEPYECLADPQLCDIANDPDNDSTSPLGRRCGCCYVYRQPENLEQSTQSFAALGNEVHALFQSYGLPAIEKNEIQVLEGTYDSEYRRDFPEYVAITPLMERLRYLNDISAFFAQYPAVREVEVQYCWEWKDGCIHVPRIARIIFDDPTVCKEYLLAWSDGLTEQAMSEEQRLSNTVVEDTLESTQIEIINRALAPFFKSTTKVFSDLNLEPPGSYSVFQLGRLAGNRYFYRRPENLKNFQDALKTVVAEIYATLDRASLPPLEVEDVDPYSDLWHHFQF